MKKNLLINKIFENYNLNPKKNIFISKNKNINWRTLINTGLDNRKNIINTKQKYIPILVDRNIKTVIAIISVVLSGKVFCPISKELPIKKFKIIKKKLNAKKFINCSDINLDKSNNIKINFNYSKKKELIDEDFFKIISELSSADDSLYVLFTSGSTGDPKGVILSYNNIINTLLWSKFYLKWKPNDIIGIATNFSFDISIFDYFVGLFYNVPMYILSNPKKVDMTIKEINQYKITSIFAVPSFFSNFVRYKLIDVAMPSLRQILSGGDFFEPDDIDKWFRFQKKISIYNVWGPTETSIVNTMYKIKKKDIDQININKPISIPVGNSQSRMKLIIVNKKNQLVNKSFVKGQILMIGDCVSKGYIGDELNSKNYITYKNNRSFLTGDIGYLDDKKFLHIVGRIDNMIKISGFRIDGKEISHLVNSDKSIEKSSVFALEIIKGINVLCLAIVSKKIIKIDKIKSHLREYLPEYSIPKYITILEEFPLNVNGKIDLKKLKLHTLNEYS